MGGGGNVNLHNFRLTKCSFGNSFDEIFFVESILKYICTLKKFERVRKYEKKKNEVLKSSTLKLKAKGES